MRTYADNTGVPYKEGSHSWLMFKVGYLYPVVCFPCHPFKVQVYIGIYSWLGLLLDDQAAEYLEEFSMFHERFCADEKQPIPLLQGWADLMRLTFRYWGPLVANFTVTSSLNFLNLMLLRPERSSTRSSAPRPAEAGHGFFEKDGGGETCAWFTFPKELCPDISLFLEVVPDISMCIGLTNDALSFYKEEKAVRLALKGWEPYLKLLNSHLLGYIAFHKLKSRYRLWEVGLGEDATDRTVLEP
ncbi:isoprenoid synthase domain-containing protein [Fusarium oxysporum II5]|nr:isoprenoid synthase domain-containing protein [Fusarium oxysporum II5]